MAARVLADLRIDRGLPMGITTTDEMVNPWDFSGHAMRVKAKRKLQEQDPESLVCSPMCTMHSPWQRTNRARGLAQYKKELRKAQQHMEFVGELFCMQMNSSMLLLHEHPAQASSWEEHCLRQLLADEDGHGPMPIWSEKRRRTRSQKPMRWMSNSARILEELDKAYT